MRLNTTQTEHIITLPESQPPSANPPSNLTLDQGQLLNPSPLEPAFNLNEPQGDRKNVENNLEEFNDDLEVILDVILKFTERFF